MYAFLSLFPVAAFWDMLAASAIPIAGIVLAGVITVSAMYFSHHQKKLLHETTRLALERGQPLSPELIATLGSAASDAKGRRNDIRTGLILIAVGAGLVLALGRIVNELRFVGAIPGLIGATLLLYGLFESQFSRKRRDASDAISKP